MVFLELWYLVFMPFALFAAWVLPKGWRATALLALCFVFHWHYAGPAGMKPILILALAVYLALRTGKLLIAAGGACVAAWLFYRQPGVQSVLGFTDPVAAPLAVSFFTFEYLHLLFDRAAGRLGKTPAPRDYLLFLLFFPSLASGPIKRYQHFHPQIARIGWPGAESAARAAARVIFGFFMKLVVANWFYSLLPRDLRSESFGSTLLLGLYCYGYVSIDLAAYSHIAIGSARLMGVTLPENVRPIFVARSFSDYWSRWHMSVTQWFRDYVLWPVAGDGRELWRFYLGVGAALFLTGIWHGASPHVLLWAAINAVAVVLESVLSRTKAWRRWGTGPGATMVPWLQWGAFQLNLVMLSILFLYPLDQIRTQLGRGW